MTSITDPKFGDEFDNAMKEIHNKHLKTVGETTDAIAGSCQSQRQFLKSARDTCLKKQKDDEMLFESIKTFERDLEQKKALFKEKHQAFSEVMTEIRQMDMQKEDLIQKIEKLKEEQAKRKELIDSKYKANKERLRNLQKSRVVFQDSLGLEIRTIQTQSVKGEQLQFIFRNINPSNEDSIYVVTMRLKDYSSYQIVSSDPVIECLPSLESRLQETNNLAAFLANVRKEFISLSRR